MLRSLTQSMTQSLVSSMVGYPSGKLVLDEIAETPIFAYGLRKLRKNYAGNCIRVRRSSDNSEQDIGFSSSDGLDETALTTFTGGGNGFITTWYDQSGNGVNATQTTANRQPQIVSSGSVIKRNGVPSSNFNIGDATSLINTVAQAVPYSINVVSEFASTSGVMMGSSPAWQRFQYSGGLLFFDGSPRAISSPVGFVATQVNTYFYRWLNGTNNQQLYINAFGVETTTVGSTVSRTGYILGNSTGFNQNFRGYISEAIGFSGSLADNSRTILLGNQINNFSIT